MEIIQYSDKYNKKVNEFICKILVEEFKKECLRKIILSEDNSDYIKQGGRFWIAIDEDDNIIGTICIYKNKNKVWELKKLYVDSKYRGEGLAHKLYKNVLEFAKEQGIERIELGTYNTFKAAIKFYLKKGFREIHKQTSEEDAIFFALEEI